MSLLVPEQDFEKLLKINTLGDFLFSGTAAGENGHLFGGYTLAFALEAASATVDPQMWPQSIHANFIDAGKSGQELR
jgi:acyl-CoA thioesterase